MKKYLIVVILSLVIIAVLFYLGVFFTAWL